MKKQKTQEIIESRFWTSRFDQVDPMKNDKSDKDEDVQMYPQGQFYTVDTILQLIDHIKSL